MDGMRVNGQRLTVRAPYLLLGQRQVSPALGLVLGHVLGPVAAGVVQHIFLEVLLHVRVTDVVDVGRSRA
jgi:hypothetical protein